MLSLRELIDRYVALAANFGDPVPLSAFGLAQEETSRFFTSLDDDYHISRFLTFSLADGQRYTISNEQATHVRIDPAIRELL